MMLHMTFVEAKRIQRLAYFEETSVKQNPGGEVLLFIYRFIYPCGSCWWMEENAKYFLYVLPVARYSYHAKNEKSSVTRVTRKLALPETNIAPENGWLLEDEISYWEGLFSGDMRVSVRVYK